MSPAASPMFATFSFILAAEWDCIPPHAQAPFQADRFNVSIDRRLDLTRAVRLLTEDDFAWINCCGRRLFSARLPVPEALGGFFDEFPLFSSFA